MLELNSISLFFMLLAKCLYCNWLLFLFKHSSLSNLVSLLFTLCSGSPFPCSYSERLCLHLLDKWLLAANRPVNHSVRCGWIHPQVSHCMLKFTSWRTDDDSSICACRPAFHQCVCVCVCVCVVVRIGQLKEVMDDILRTQCDYDPASGESYDFDRFVFYKKVQLERFKWTNSMLRWCLYGCNYITLTKGK